MDMLALLFSTLIAGMPMPAVNLLPQPEAQEIEIQLRTGKSIDVKVLSVTDKDVVVELAGFEGSQATFPLAALTAQSVCDVQREVLKNDDVVGWRRLADFAKKSGQQAEYVAALDVLAGIDAKQAPAIKTELETARSQLAQSRLDLGKKYLAGGQLLRARESFNDVAMYKSTPAAAEADKLLQVVDQDQAKARNDAAAALDMRAKVRAGNDQMQTIHALVERGETALNAAMAATDNKVNAQREFQAAIALFRHAGDSLRSIDKTLTTNTGASDSQNQLNDLRRESEQLRLAIEGDLAQSYIELGYLYVSMTRNVDATRCANLAASIDSNDPSVAALRQAIMGPQPGAWRSWGGWRAVAPRR